MYHIAVGTISQAQHYISAVCNKPYTLTNNEHRVEPEQAISHNNAWAQQTNDPEANRQIRSMTPVRIIPLIHKADGKNKLAGRAKHEQPQGHVAVMQKMLNEEFGLWCHKAHCHYGQGKYQSTEHQWHTGPNAFDVQVPDVNVIRN